MLKKVKEEKKINARMLNELVSTGNKILKILHILFIILLIYVFTLILNEWGILKFLGKTFSIISPLFIGFIIAWILNPLVIKLTQKKMKRPLAVTIVYILTFFVIYLVCAFTIPSLGTQMTEIVAAVPDIVTDVKGWIDDLFVKLSNISLQNLDHIKSTFFLRIETFATDIQTDLPRIVVNLISNVASGLGNIIMSFIIGFYILFDFDKFSKSFISIFPKKIRKDVQKLTGKLSECLYSYVSGTLWLSILLFIVSAIGFSIIGLNAPILIAFVCVITNLIPYIGPYLGAAIAGAIGFTQSFLIGILTLIFILIVQTIEGNFLQPLVMSKKMNLSPITIIVSLLIFGYFWGIIGMVIATPLVAIIKIIYEFLDSKFNFFSFDDGDPDEKNN